jgi:quercetin dioxygenase-like cupin family protein
MEIVPKVPSVKGPGEWFTGDVWIDAIAGGLARSHLSVNVVRFSPGARTAWHSHNLGQTLFVTEGRGLVQSRGDVVVEIRPGDVISTPDGEEHWHGAAPDHFMTHLSMTEGDARWGEHVSDTEYGGRSDS